MPRVDLSMRQPSAATFALAVIGPTVLAYNVSPSATVLNQLACLIGWGLVLAASARRVSSGLDNSTTLSWGLALIAAGVCLSITHSLPQSLGLSALALLAAALVVAWHAASDSPGGVELARYFILATLAAGALSTVIAFVQVFAPGLFDGGLIARSGVPGRAVGNLRQPNHLSSLLLWALVAWVPVAQGDWLARWKIRRAALLVLAALFIWADVLSASRTGVVGVVLLAIWGAVDRRLARWVRVSLLMAPFVYLVFWLAMAAWSHTTGHTFGGEARLSEQYLTSSRWAIWMNTLAMIRAQPWAGVGWGEFNFAWTLTPFPNRPVAFFDHSHNLVLQLWSELGLPWGTLVLALLLWALWQAGLRSWKVTGDAGVSSRATFVMVLMIGVHSLFEYPLWYAYFLLPTAWAWGHALRSPTSPISNLYDLGYPARGGAFIRACGVLLVLGSLFALHDYWKVVVIYAPADGAGPLTERVEHGQASIFFSHQADYAAATTAEPPSRAMAAFDSTTHSLLDTRLMMSWAQALAESGHRDKAAYLAARLREFRNPASAEFFEVCNDAAAAAESPRPYQCEPAPEQLTWRDFRPGSE